MPQSATGTMSVGGAAVPLTDTVSGQQLVWTFPGTAGQQVSVELTGYSGLAGGSTLYLFDARGHLYGNNNLQWISTGTAATAALGPFTLPLTETYTVVLWPSGLATGTASVQIISLPPSANATLTVGGAAVPLTDTVSGQQLVWTFQGMAGQQVSVELTSYAGLAGGSTLYVYDQQSHLYGNNNLQWISNGIVATAALGPYTLPQTGTYTVVLVPSGLPTGSATVQVFSVPHWTFQGTAGQQVSLSLNGYSGLAGSSSLYLYDQQGRLYGNNNLQWISNGSISTTPLGPYMLPQTSTYTVVLVPSGLATGNATVQVFSVPQSVTGTLMVGGAAVQLTSTVSGEQLAWTFQGTAGQQISVELTGYVGLAGGSSLYLYDQLGHLYGNNNLQWISNGSVATAALGPYTLPQPGTYTVVLLPSGTATGQQISVEVTSYSGLAGGSSLYLYDQQGHLYGNNNLQWICNGSTAVAALGPYMLAQSGTYTALLLPSGLPTGTATVRVFSVPQSATGSLTLGGAAVSLANTVSGQQLVWTFHGTVGQQINIALNGYTGLAGGSSLYLYDQQGHLYGNNNLQWISNGSAATAPLGPFTLAQTGIYTIVLAPSGLATGNANVQLLNATPVKGSLTVGGAALTLTDVAPWQPLVWTFSGNLAQRVTIWIPSYSGLSAGSGVNFYDQRGRVYLANAPLSGLVNRSAGTYTLDANATYTLKLVPIGTAIGSAMVQVSP